MIREEYYEKVHGAWLGRVAGSHFGIPIEFRPYKRIQKKYCDGGQSEITGYVKPVDPETVNDDEIYEIIGLLTLKEKWLDITAEDIARKWDELLYKSQYTAERVALKNIRKGIMPPGSSSPSNDNYWYDAIGGQMKGDIWGLVAPGNPELASELARIDGQVAHQGIGIDGEVFIATIIANAFETGDREHLIRKGLEYIDESSEYRKFVEKSIEIYENNPKWRDGREQMVDEWNRIRKRLRREADSWKRKVIFLTGIPNVHVLPNAGIITLSLLYGQDDTDDPFGRPICLAGMMAFDTDCNCGNIGTIMGTICGAARIPDKWKEPLNDTFNTYVRGYESWKISDLAEQITKIGFKLQNHE